VPVPGTWSTVSSKTFICALRFCCGTGSAVRLIARDENSVFPSGPQCTGLTAHEVDQVLAVAKKRPPRTDGLDLNSSNRCVTPKAVGRMSHANFLLKCTTKTDLFERARPLLARCAIPSVDQSHDWNRGVKRHLCRRRKCSTRPSRCDPARPGRDLVCFEHVALRAQGKTI
jgi:hypothetical protein